MSTLAAFTAAHPYLSGRTKMSTHTPGPWEFVLDDDGASSGVTFVIRMGSHLRGRNGWEPQHRIEYEVSSKVYSPKQFAEAEANVSLIAAAPDLLAACKAAAKWAHQMNADTHAVLRAAIAKAEDQR